MVRTRGRAARPTERSGSGAVPATWSTVAESGRRTPVSACPYRAALLAPVLLGALVLSWSCVQESWESTIMAGRQALAAGRHAEAERAFTAALTKARASGSDDHRVALSLTFLAQTYQSQKKFVEAEPLYVEALAIMQAVRGIDHPDVAAILNNLGVLHRMHGQYPEAEQYLRRALAIKERTLGESHPEVALTLMNLARLRSARGDDQDAIVLYERVVAIHEQALEPGDPRRAEPLARLASALRRVGRVAEAQRLERRVQSLGSPSTGRETP